MKKKKSYLGLDLGTNSIGWALTDEDYNLRRIKGKNTWGVRLFDEAKSCQERGVYRKNRRRLERRKYRIKMLQELFKNEVSKKDLGFYLRLKESSYHLEDKSAGNSAKQYIFGNRSEEKAYHVKYPTIWHLRKDLLSEDSPAYSDVRMVYLAVHHIMKYRGNFLKEGQTLSDHFQNEDIQIINESFSRLNEDGLYCEVLMISEKEKLENLLLDTSLGITEKRISFVNSFMLKIKI